MPPRPVCLTLEIASGASYDQMKAPQRALVSRFVRRATRSTMDMFEPCPSAGNSLDLCQNSSFPQQSGVSPPRHKAHGGSAHIEWSCLPRLAGAVPKEFSHCISNNGRPESACNRVECHSFVWPPSASAKRSMRVLGSPAPWPRDAMVFWFSVPFLCFPLSFDRNRHARLSARRVEHGQRVGVPSFSSIRPTASRMPCSNACCGGGQPGT